MKFLRRCVSILVLATSFFGAERVAEEPALRIAAAASLADVLKELNPTFTHETGAAVNLNLGASNILARQIEEGAPSDVFFSADSAKMDQLGSKGLIVEATREDQLSNSLVVIATHDGTVALNTIEDLRSDRVARIATGDPKSVPAGVYARAYLEKTGLWKDLEKKIVPTENVRGALAAVESGNVAAGIVYKTDAALSRKVKVVLEIPADDLKITYPMAMLKEARQPKLAARYLEFLDTPVAKAIFEKYGFIVLPEASAP